MVTYRFRLLLSFLLSASVSAPAQDSSKILFDDNWRFSRGKMQGAEREDFDDSPWRKIDLPHDWSIEDLPGTGSAYRPDAISQVSGGFTTGGTAWYRKTFVVPESRQGQVVSIQFDGVYMNSDVWINGVHLGNHPYGYTSFWYDLTKYIHFGKENTISVEVKNEGLNSRWYSGSGIYRHVWLAFENPVHLTRWSTQITTPVINKNEATVQVKTRLVNEGTHLAEIRIVIRVLDKKGAVLAREEKRIDVKPKEAVDVSHSIALIKPQLWSCGKPDLYKAVIGIYRNGKLTGSETELFGVRTISFDKVHGFRLNGETVKLKGGCFHHDNGPLGTKAYDRAEIRKVELLKASGFNAIRCSHNPPTTAFLDACDSLGMLVIDEAFDMWNEAKNPDDYHLYFKDWWKRDMETMLARDRNHPSIIMWSIGNEIPESNKPEGVETAKMLADYVKKFDTTRAVTSAVAGLNPDKDPYFARLDVAGYNYAFGGDHNISDIYALDHARIPGRIIFEPESYPLEAFGSWMAVVDHPYVIGSFVWTAFDYIGESSIGWLGYTQNPNFYPWNLAFCGDLDICGWKRPQSYYRDALWKSNQLSVFVTSPEPSYQANPNHQSWSKWNWYDVIASWNWKGGEARPLEVIVYSSCEQAELFINNRSLGKKPTGRSTRFMARWEVPYEPGELKAIGFTGNKPVNMSLLQTAGQTEQVKLTADRPFIKADGQDLCYVTIELLDDKGRLNPNAEDLLHFEIEGDASIAGVGNANPTSIESHQQTQRKAWKGKCLVIVKAGKTPGNVKLKVTGGDLKPAEMVIGLNQCVNYETFP